MFYDRPHLIKKWIVCIGLSEKQQEAVKKAIPKKEPCFFKPWPSLTMKDELMKLATQGYADHIQSMPFFLDLTLALRAVSNITRSHNPLAQISHLPPYHRSCKNRIETDEDYTRLMNDILAANDDITLSQVFATSGHDSDIWLSFEADKNVVQKLAREVIIIGNDPKFDVDLTDLTAGKDINSAISHLFR